MKLIIVFLLFITIISSATELVGDYLIVGSEKYVMRDIPSEMLLKKLGISDLNKLINNQSWFTSNPRGYNATWEIKGDSIFFCNINIWNRESEQPKEITLEELVLLANKDTVVDSFCDWLTTKMLIVSGPLVWSRGEYVREFLFPLKIKNGIVTNINKKWETFFLKPEYSNGITALKEVIYKNLDWKNINSKNKVGQFAISFLVEENGNVLVNEVYSPYSEINFVSIKKMISKIDKWRPAKVGGVNNKCIHTIALEINNFIKSKYSQN